MRKWIQALSLVPLLAAAFPSMATLMTGTDGALAPTTDYTLTYRADGMFDFTAIDIGSGVTLRFDTQIQNVTLLSLGDIRVAGVIDAMGIDLVLETPGRIAITGSISADSISLTGNSLSWAGDKGVGAEAISRDLCLSRVCRPRTSSLDGSLLPTGTLQVRSGADITIRAPVTRVFTVPEPATPWLVTLLLPMLALFTRRPSI